MRRDILHVLLSALKRARILRPEAAVIATEVFLREIEQILDHEISIYDGKDQSMTKGLRHARELFTLRKEHAR